MLTINTSAPNYNKYPKNTTSFKSASLPKQSAFLNPLKKGFNKLTDKIEEYYTAPLYSSKIANGLSNRNDISNIVEHMQAIGSYIISGMYMIQTLRNQNMDDDRKTTLAINQGLTLVASTAMAYFISRRLEGPWDKNITMKYAAKKLNINVDELAERLKKYQKETKQKYFTEHPDEIIVENANIRKMKKLYKKQNKTLNKFNEYINNLISEKSIELELKKFKTPNLADYIKEGLGNKDLATKVKGSNTLKSLIVFGSVYRFFGPVAVTPVATWIGNMITGANKKNANVKNETPKQNQQDNSDYIKRPHIAKFLGNVSNN